MRFMDSMEPQSDVQAFGFEERGNRSMDCWPGTAVLETCSSTSSADARSGLVILEDVDRRRVGHVVAVVFRRFPRILFICEVKRWEG